MEPNAGPTQPADAAAMAFSSAGDWRTHLQPESRVRIVNRIADTLQRHLPISPDGVSASRRIAVQFEQKVYCAASSQNDYLRKISLNMLSMVNKTPQSAPINPAIPNAEAVNQNPTYQAIPNVEAVNQNPTYQANAGPTQPTDVMAMAFSSAAVVDDWRTHLQPEARLRITNKISETLLRYLPISAPDGINAIMKISVPFEEKIYNAATSQSDYLRKISLKMLSMEKKTLQSTPINPAISNIEAVNQNPTYQGITYEAVTLNRPNKRPHISANRSRVYCDLEEDSHTKRMKVSEPVPEKVVQEESTSSSHSCMAEKQKETTFSCPICMCVLVSPFTTVCGHVFCEDCIKAATKKAKKCPTCRSKLTGRNKIHRVFLPTTD